MISFPQFRCPVHWDLPPLPSGLRRWSQSACFPWKHPSQWWEGRVMDGGGHRRRQCPHRPSDSALGPLTNGKAEGSHEEARESFLLKHLHLNIKMPRVSSVWRFFVQEDSFRPRLPALLLCQSCPTFIILPCSFSTCIYHFLNIFCVNNSHFI